MSIVSGEKLLLGQNRYPYHINDLMQRKGGLNLKLEENIKSNEY